MSTKSRILSVLLVATLMVVAGCSMLTPKANAAFPVYVTWNSKQDNGATINLGTIKVDVPIINLPLTTMETNGWHTISYNPAPGFYFVRWESSTGSITFDNANAQTTKVNLQMDGTVTAVYSTRSAVGGVVLPTNSLTVLAPYLVMIGLVATAAIAVKKRRN